MVSILLFLIGVFFGSFLNVVIDRLPRRETIIAGRSHCDFCGHTLAWYDLIPLFSFLFLQGKCRYCKKFIGWKYPSVETTTGIIFVLTYLFVPLNMLFPIILFINCCLIIIFFTDLFYGIIPDSVLIFLVLLTGITGIFSKNILPNFLTGLVTLLFFFFLFIITKKKGIGFGDVKYSFIMGFLIGFPYIIPGLYIAFLTGAGIALILMVAGKKHFKSSIAFGPFLVIGTVSVLFWGPSIWLFMQRLLGLS